MQNKFGSNIIGHILAILCILIWGTTFIASKLLLEYFHPSQVLFFRFLIGYFILWIIYPHFQKPVNISTELLFIGAGLTGVTLYYLVENTALLYTYTTNVSIIVSSAPMATGIVMHFFSHEKLTRFFIIGFALSIIGIAFVSFNGSLVLHLNPIGDILAACAAISWAFYTLFTKKIGYTGFNIIGATRRIFFYAIILSLPIFLYNDPLNNINELMQAKTILNLLFLAVIASAICYPIWNHAIVKIGAIKSSKYIYLIPIVTLATSSIFLNEKITIMGISGVLICIIGLFVSDIKKTV